MTSLPLLSLAIWVPVFAGFLVLLTGDDKNASSARWIALLGSLAAFAVTIPLYTGFNPPMVVFNSKKAITGFQPSTFITIWVWMALLCH